MAILEALMPLPMREEDRKPVLLNEGNNTVIQAVTGKGRLEDIPLRVVEMDLGDADGKFGAMHVVSTGEVAGIVTGIDMPTKEVVRAAIKVIGIEGGKEAGLVSSFFAMKREGEPTLYLGDCGVLPEPTAEQLVMVADQTVTNVTKFGEREGKKPVVAFLRAPGEVNPGEPDIVGDALAAYTEAHPDVNMLGAMTWREAREQGADTFIFPNLNSGNIGYKVLHDPEASGWQAIETGGDVVTVLEKPGEKLYVSKCEPHMPTADELVEMAVQSYELARRDSGDENPTVAMLSYSTMGSGTSNKPTLADIVQFACDKLAKEHPEIPIAGPVQWDAATEPAIYAKKTGNKTPNPDSRVFPGGKKPTVMVCPDRDSSVLIAEMLQEPDVGGRIAIGPIIQGLRNGMRVVDLSRSANKEDVEGAIRVAAGEAP